MARRELQEINAGSMADIAFLLLIFWLVTTTIDSDEGIKRQLPPPVPPDIDVPQAKEQNVFNVKVNFLDQLLVEGEPLDLDQLKDKAKNFLIATGDGVMSHNVGPKTIGRNRDVEMITGANGKTNAAFPEREWVRKSVTAQVTMYWETYFDCPLDQTALTPPMALNISSSPKTAMIAAGCDPLMSDTPQYADKLRQAGVAVDVVIEDGLPHGYLRARYSVDRARLSFQRITTAISSMVASD